MQYTREGFFFAAVDYVIQNLGVFSLSLLDTMIRTLTTAMQPVTTEVFRSMHVNTSSSTPYSDATQVMLKGFFFLS